MKKILLLNLKNNMPNRFVDFGLGIMTEPERAKLLADGAIVNIKGVDHIACDGYCVNVYKHDEPICVFEGNKFQCEMEASNIKKNKPDIKVEVRNYPKSFEAYLDVKYPSYEEEK